MAKLHPTVKALGAVSLLTDVSSEMIYPLLPAYLTRVLGAGPAFLGLVEGAAEAVASLTKMAAGWLADRAPRKKPLVVAGYTLSALVRPVVALAMAPWHVLAIRIADRIGKGARGAPRDALLAEVTPSGDRGRAYGFHRAMDHAGATIGPLLAVGILLFTDDPRVVFAAALLPGLLSVAVLVFLVREESRERGSADRAASHAEPASRRLPRSLVLYLAALSLFTLGNSSDAFLLLRAQEAGVTLGAVPLLWAFHHLVKAAASTHGGRWSDRVGRRRAILMGWAIYAAAYGGFAAMSRPFHAWVLFALYGLFHAMTEGAERALVADLAPAHLRGWAFGLFHALTGGLLLPASLLTGSLWQAFGPAAALGTGATLAGLAEALMLLFVKSPRS